MKLKNLYYLLSNFGACCSPSSVIVYCNTRGPLFFFFPGGPGLPLSLLGIILHAPCKNLGGINDGKRGVFLASVVRVIKQSRCGEWTPGHQSRSKEFFPPFFSISSFPINSFFEHDDDDKVCCHCCKTPPPPLNQSGSAIPSLSSIYVPTVPSTRSYLASRFKYTTYTRKVRNQKALFYISFISIS